jgi:3-hydroxy-3-methylglutaryl CoA synthase
MFPVKFVWKKGEFFLIYSFCSISTTFLIQSTRRYKQRNADIRNKLKQNKECEIRKYQQNWFQHVNRMENNRLEKLAL